MKIKEVETLTGITSKNIRFYECQGLLKPKRNILNGYRDYTQEDISRLKLIKIFRKLGVSVDQIKSILNEKNSLVEVIKCQYEYFEKSIKEMEEEKKICKTIELEKLDISNINIDFYLERIENKEKQGSYFFGIIDDFKKLYKEMARSRYVFESGKLITNEREFTDELIKFSNNQKIDLTILKEGMEPIVEINKIKYNACRDFVSQHVYIVADDENLIIDKMISSKRRRVFKIVMFIIVLIVEGILLECLRWFW